MDAEGRKVASPFLPSSPASVPIFYYELTTWLGSSRTPERDRGSKGHPSLVARRPS